MHRQNVRIPIIPRRYRMDGTLPYSLLGTALKPGTRSTVKLQSPNHAGNPLTITILNGAKPGPVLCLTGAIHGDELNGVEIVRQTVAGIDIEKLQGTIIAIPVVNVEGYLHRSRLLDDSSDLNRSFPGNKGGVYSEQFANILFTNVITHCDALIDLHCGGSSRLENLPQLRADIFNPLISHFAKAFTRLSIVQDVAPKGSLRAAATAEGIIAVVVEIGGSQGLETENVFLGVESLQMFLQAAQMIGHHHTAAPKQSIYRGGGWVRAENAGILVSRVALGQAVVEGEVIAEIIEPLTGKIFPVAAPLSGTLLSRAHNQVVTIGFGIFRVGILS